MTRRAVLAVVWLATSASLVAQDWPAFRGANATGVADGKPTPVKWNVATGENVLWKTPVAGVAVSSPIVWGNRVFVSTAVSSDSNAGIRTGQYGDVEPVDDKSKHTWRLVALDKRSGNVLWDRVAHEGIPKTKRHPKSSQASATPVTDGRRVIVSFGSEGLYAYDFDGKLLWKRDLGVLNAGWFYDPDYEWGLGSSPIIYRNLVIVQCDIQKDSFIAAFDVATGSPVWRTPREEIPSWSTPAIHEAPGGRAELVTQATGFTRGYDPATGTELWRLGGNSEIAIPTPIIAPGLIIVTNGYRGVQPIYAIKPGASGDITLRGEETTNSAIAWSLKRGGPYIPTPVLYRDQLYVGQNNGVVASYDAKTGQRVYQERLGPGGSYSASPVAGDGKVYFTSEDGDVFVVKAGPTYELLSTNPVGEILMATPAISDGVLFFRGLKHVIAIGVKP
jgi:outer membrane protein assembly factor BamB